MRSLALQDLLSLEDEPRQKLLIELRRRHYPPPLGQDRRGTPEGIRSLTSAVIRGHYQKMFRPAGTILSVAGNVEWEPLRDQVARLFGDWQGGTEPTLIPRRGGVRSRAPEKRHDADANRHRLSERADRPSRLLRRPGGRQRAVTAA